MSITIPENYKSLFDPKTTEIAIHQIKDCFEKTFVKAFNLKKVSSPPFLLSESDLSNDFNENSVLFNIKSLNKTAEIPYSLIKWKRYALKKYGFNYNEGLYTTLSSIRQKETLDNLNSLFSDTWEWEKIISENERSIDTLKQTASQIFSVLKIVESYIHDIYPFLTRFLPSEIKFITNSKLKEMYPDLNSEEREEKITKEYKGVFFIQTRKSACEEKNIEKTPDYNDWNLSGYLLVWFPVLNCTIKILSLGIRADKSILSYQLEDSDHKDAEMKPFNQAILNDELPFTMGGEINQSKLCMLFLEKAHIGEVQPSIWPEAIEKQCEDLNIFLL